MVKIKMFLSGFAHAFKVSSKSGSFWAAILALLGVAVEIFLNVAYGIKIDDYLNSVVAGAIQAILVALIGNGVVQNQTDAKVTPQQLEATYTKTIKVFDDVTNIVGDLKAAQAAQTVTSTPKQAETASESNLTTSKKTETADLAAKPIEVPTQNAADPTQESQSK